MPRHLSCLLALALLNACSNGAAPSSQLLERAGRVWEDERRIVEAFPEPSALAEVACPEGMQVRKVGWATLCPAGGPAWCPKSKWVHQTGTEGYADQPSLHRLSAYTTKPSKSRTRELERAVALHEAASHVGIARNVKVVEGHRTGPDTFVGGYVESWVVVFERDTAKIACAARIHAKNDDMALKGRVALEVYDKIRAEMTTLAKAHATPRVD